MDRIRLLAVSLGLLLVVSLCLCLILWLQIQQLEDDITQLRNRPQILFPGGGSIGGMRPE